MKKDGIKINLKGNELTFEDTKGQRNVRLRSMLALMEIVSEIPVINPLDTRLMEFIIMQQSATMLETEEKGNSANLSNIISGTLTPLAFSEIQSELRITDFVLPHRLKIMVEAIEDKRVIFIYLLDYYLKTKGHLPLPFNTICEKWRKHHPEDNNDEPELVIYCLLHKAVTGKKKMKLMKSELWQTLHSPKWQARIKQDMVRFQQICLHYIPIIRDLIKQWEGNI